MATSSAPSTSRPSFVDQFIYGSQEDFNTFMNSIKDFLNKNEFAQLHSFFYLNGTQFQGNLEDEGSLELLLESYLNSDQISDENFTRAIELTNLMEQNICSPTWAKIAKAVLYYDRGEIKTGNYLVKQMVERDQEPNFSLRTRSELVRLRDEYCVLEKPLMEGRIQAILKVYNEITVSLPPLTRSDAFEVWLQGRV